jgi:hypothetical protein
MSNTTTRTFDYVRTTSPPSSGKSPKPVTPSRSGTAKPGPLAKPRSRRLPMQSAAGKHAAKLIAEKTGKGYVERDGASPAPAGLSTSVVTESTAISAEALKASKKAGPAKYSHGIQGHQGGKAQESPLQDPEATPESLLALFGKDDATNRLLAKHPRASAELLEKLSHSSDKATRQGVAGNPNTLPLRHYVKLGQQFPRRIPGQSRVGLAADDQPGPHGRGATGPIDSTAQTGRLPMHRC